MNMRNVMSIMLCVWLAVTGACAESTIDSTNKWAWSESAGWINCQADLTNGVIIGEYACSGYMWSEATGWIHLGDGAPTNGIYYTNTSTNDYGVNHDGAGNLSGYGWSPAIEWVSFESNGAPRVDLQNGYISGYAWGGSVGWISFSNVLAFTKTLSITNAPDDDSDGIADPWEIEYAGDTNSLGGTNDWDGDGVSDVDEYLAGTSPTDMASFFKVSGFASSNGTNMMLTWQWEPSRLYKVQELDDLTNHPDGWVDSSLGLMYSEETSNVTVQLPVTSSQQFYRAVAVKPLSP